MPFKDMDTRPNGSVTRSSNFNKVVDNVEYVWNQLGGIESKNTDQEAWFSSIGEPFHDQLNTDIVDLENYYNLASDPINTNTGFEQDTAHWGASGGTIASSTDHARSGSASMKVTPDADTGTTYVFVQCTEALPVVVGNSYKSEMFAYSDVEYPGDILIQTLWQDGSGNVISARANSFSVPAATWTLMEVTATAPQGAVAAVFRCYVAYKDAADIFYIDDATFRRSPRLHGGTWQTLNDPSHPGGSSIAWPFPNEVVPPSGCHMNSDNTVLTLDVAGVWAIDSTVMLESADNRLFGLWIGNANDSLDGWAKQGGVERDQLEAALVRYFNKGDEISVWAYVGVYNGMNEDNVQSRINAYRIGNGEALAI